MTRNDSAGSAGLEALAERIRAATGPCREIDAALHLIRFGGRMGMDQHGLRGVEAVYADPDSNTHLLIPFPFTGFVEFAERLLDDEGGYPEWQLTRRHPTGYHASVGTGDDTVGCETPALALCLAAALSRAGKSS